MLRDEDKEEWTGTYKPSGQIASVHAKNRKPVIALGVSSIRGLTGRAAFDLSLPVRLIASGCGGPGQNEALVLL